MSKTFHSLRYVNFRLWFGANIIASTGSWMQRVAQDWLVLTVLTSNSGVQVGVVTALQFLPMIFLSPWAGVLADRMNRRHLLQFTQLVTGLLGLILGVLVLTNSAQLWHVYVLAFIGGVVSALDSPARQAFVSELVTVTDLPNAVGLNSTAFNTARMIGPAVSGLLIQWVGIGWVLIINAVLFLAPVVALALIREDELVPRRRVPRQKGQIREGIRYVRHRPDIIVILVTVAVVSALGMNFQLTSALMATEVFGKQAGEYGILSSFMATGALVGSLLAARRRLPRMRMIIIAAGLYGIAEIFLGLSPTYWSFALLCLPTGLAMLTMITAANATIQMTTDESMRGRVMALYSMIFLGVTPIGSPLVGWIGETWGARWSILVGGIASVLVAIVCALWAKKYWDLHLRLSRSRRSVTIEGPVERARIVEENTEGQRRAQVSN
ncbi:MFS transporter [Schaalia sp. ZJ405]|uniref:MFS transporter n=1 Tax=unclassified Schaalia TaxID=2691889 RepID=UPI0013ED4A4A|nr:MULTISPECIES: MFS transporter [unclassified Schaalia]QPK81024.1 MFS transporter [Schaalia sp. ZJ405]